MVLKNIFIKFNDEKISFDDEFIFDFTSNVFNFPIHLNEEENIMKKKHKKLEVIHKKEIDDLKIPKKCKLKNDLCKHNCKNIKSCEKEYKKKCKKICPDNCGCEYKCICGWEPKEILPDKTKSKQFNKHFKMCAKLEVLGKKEEERDPNLNVKFFF